MAMDGGSGEGSASSHLSLSQLERAREAITFLSSLPVVGSNSNGKKWYCNCTGLSHQSYCVSKLQAGTLRELT